MSAEIVRLYPTCFEQSEALLHKSRCYGNRLQTNPPTPLWVYVYKLNVSFEIEFYSIT